MTQFIDNAIVERSDDWAYQSVDQIIQQSLSVIQDPDEGASVQGVSSVDTARVSSESPSPDDPVADTRVWRSFILDTIQRTVTELGQAYGVDTASVDHIQRVLADTRSLDQVQILAEWSPDMSDRVEATIVRATQRALLDHRLAALGIVPYTAPPSASAVLYPSGLVPLPVSAVSVPMESVDTAVLQLAREAAQSVSGPLALADWIALAQSISSGLSVVDAPEYCQSIAVMLGVTAAGESVQGIVFPDADGVQRMITSVNLVDLDAPIESVHASEIRPAILRYSDTAMVVDGPIPGLGVRMLDRAPIVPEAIAVDAGRLGQVIATEQTQGRNPMTFIDPDAAVVVDLVNDWQASGYVQAGMTESEIMTAVHRYVADRIAYQSDVGDQWQTVEQTLARGAGDCEDMAILVASLAARALHAVGMNDLAETVRLEAGLMADGAVGHMVARVGEQWVVDATQSVAIQDRTAVAMDSVYVLGMNGVQQTGRLDQVARLKRVGTAGREADYLEFRKTDDSNNLAISGAQTWTMTHSWYGGSWSYNSGSFSDTTKWNAIIAALNTNTGSIEQRLESVRWTTTQRIHTDSYMSWDRRDDKSGDYENSIRDNANNGDSGSIFQGSNQRLYGLHSYDVYRHGGAQPYSFGDTSRDWRDHYDITLGHMLTTTEINHLANIIREQPSQGEIDRRYAIANSIRGYQDLASDLFGYFYGFWLGSEDDVIFNSGVSAFISNFADITKDTERLLNIGFISPNQIDAIDAINYIFGKDTSNSNSIDDVANFSGTTQTLTSVQTTDVDNAVSKFADNNENFKKILKFSLSNSGPITPGNVSEPVTQEQKILKATNNIKNAVERAKNIYNKLYGSGLSINVGDLQDYLVGAWIEGVDYTYNPYEILDLLTRNRVDNPENYAKFSAHYVTVGTLNSSRLTKYTNIREDLNKSYDTNNKNDLDSLARAVQNADDSYVAILNEYFNLTLANVLVAVNDQMSDTEKLSTMLHNIQKLRQQQGLSLEQARNLWFLIYSNELGVQNYYGSYIATHIDRDPIKFFFEKLTRNDNGTFDFSRAQTETQIAQALYETNTPPPLFSFSGYFNANSDWEDTISGINSTDISVRLTASRNLYNLLKQKDNDDALSIKILTYILLKTDGNTAQFLPSLEADYKQAAFYVVDAVLENDSNVEIDTILGHVKSSINDYVFPDLQDGKNFADFMGEYKTAKRASFPVELTNLSWHNDVDFPNSLGNLATSFTFQDYVGAAGFDGGDNNWRYGEGPSGITISINNPQRIQTNQQAWDRFKTHVSNYDPSVDLSAHLRGFRWSGGLELVGTHNDGTGGSASDLDSAFNDQLSGSNNGIVGAEHRIARIPELDPFGVGFDTYISRTIQYCLTEAEIDYFKNLIQIYDGNIFESGVESSDISNYLNSVVSGSSVVSGTGIPKAQFASSGTAFLSDDVIDSLDFYDRNRATQIDSSLIERFTNLPLQLFTYNNGNDLYTLTDEGKIFGAALNAAEGANPSFDFKIINKTASEWRQVDLEHDLHDLDRIFFNKHFFIINDKIIQKKEITANSLIGVSPAVKSFFTEQLTTENVFGTDQKAHFIAAYNATKGDLLIKQNVTDEQIQIFKNHLKTRSLVPSKVISILQPTAAQLQASLDTSWDQLNAQRLITVQANGAFSNAILIADLSSQLDNIDQGQITASSFSMIGDGSLGGEIISFLKGQNYVSDEGYVEDKFDSDIPINYDGLTASLSDDQKSVIHRIFILAKTKKAYWDSVNELNVRYGTARRSHGEAISAIRDEDSDMLGRYTTAITDIKNCQTEINRLQREIYDDMLEVVNSLTREPSLYLGDIDSNIDTWSSQDISELRRYYLGYINSDVNGLELGFSTEKLKVDMLGIISDAGLVAASQEPGQLSLDEGTYIYDYRISSGPPKFESKNFRQIVEKLGEMEILGNNESIPNNFEYTEQDISTIANIEGIASIDNLDGNLDDYDFKYINGSIESRVISTVSGANYVRPSRFIHENGETQNLDLNGSKVCLNLNLGGTEYILVTSSGMYLCQQETDGVLATQLDTESSSVTGYKKTIQGNGNKASLYGIAYDLSIDSGEVNEVLKAINFAKPITPGESGDIIDYFKDHPPHDSFYINSDSGRDSIYLNPNVIYPGFVTGLTDVLVNTERAKFVNSILEESWQLFKGQLTSDLKGRVNSLKSAKNTFSGTTYKNQEEVKEKFSNVLTSFLNAYYKDGGLLYYIPKSNSNRAALMLEASGYTIPTYDPLMSSFTMDTQSSILMNTIELQRVQRELFLSATSIRTNLQHLMNKEAKVTAKGLVIEAYLYTTDQSIEFERDDLTEGSDIDIYSMGQSWLSIANGDQRLGWMHKQDEEDTRYTWDEFKNKLLNNELNWGISLPSDFVQTNENAVLSAMSPTGVKSSASEALKNYADTLTGPITMQNLQEYVSEKQAIESEIKAAPSAIEISLSRRSGIQRKMLANAIALRDQSFSMAGVKRMVAEALKMKHVLNFLYYLISQYSNRIHLFLAVLYDAKLESATPASAQFDPSELSEMLSTVYSNRIAVLQKEIAEKEAELGLDLSKSASRILDNMWNNPEKAYQKGAFNAYKKAVREVSQIMFELELLSTMTAVSDQAKSIVALSNVDNGLESVSVAETRMNQQYNSMVTYERSKEMEAYMLAMTDLINALSAPEGVDIDSTDGRLVISRDRLEDLFRERSEERGINFNSEWLEENKWNDLKTEIMALLTAEELSSLLKNGHNPHANPSNPSSTLDLLSLDYEHEPIPLSHSHTFSVTDVLTQQDVVDSFLGLEGRAESIVIEVYSKVPRPEGDYDQIKQLGEALHQLDNEVNGLFYTIHESVADATADISQISQNQDAYARGEIDDAKMQGWVSLIDNIRISINTVYASHSNIQTYYLRKINALDDAIQSLQSQGTMNGDASKPVPHVTFGSPDDASTALNTMLGDGKGYQITGSLAETEIDIFRRPMFDVDEAKLLGIRDSITELSEVTEILSLLVKKTNTRYRRIMEAMYGRSSGSSDNNLLSMVSDNKDFVDTVLSSAEDAVGSLKDYVGQAMNAQDQYLNAVIDEEYDRADLSATGAIPAGGIAIDAASPAAGPLAPVVQIAGAGAEASVEIALAENKRSRKLDLMTQLRNPHSDQINMGDIYSLMSTGDPDLDEKMHESLYAALSSDSSIVGNANGFSALDPNYINSIRRQLEIAQKMRALRIELDMRHSELMENLLKAIYNVTPDGYLNNLKSMMQFRSEFGLTIFDGIQRDMQDEVARRNKDYEKNKHIEEINAQFRTEMAFIAGGFAVSLIPVAGTVAKSAMKNFKIISRISERMNSMMNSLGSIAKKMTPTLSSSRRLQGKRYRRLKYLNKNKKQLSRVSEPPLPKSKIGGAKTLSKKESDMLIELEVKKAEALKASRSWFTNKLVEIVGEKTLKKLSRRMLYFNAVRRSILFFIQGTIIPIRKGSGDLEHAAVNQSIDLNIRRTSTTEAADANVQELKTLLEGEDKVKSDAARAILMAVLMDLIFEKYQQELLDILQANFDGNPEDNDKAYYLSYQNGFGTKYYSVDHGKIADVGVKVATRQANLHVGLMVANTNVRIMDAVMRTFMGAPARNKTSVLSDFFNISQSSIRSSLDQVKRYMEQRVDLKNKQQAEIREMKEATAKLIIGSTAVLASFFISPALVLAGSSFVMGLADIALAQERSRSARSDFNNKSIGKLYNSNSTITNNQNNRITVTTNLSNSKVNTVIAKNASGNVVVTNTFPSNQVSATSTQQKIGGKVVITTTIVDKKTNAVTVVVTEIQAPKNDEPIKVVSNPKQFNSRSAYQAYSDSNLINTDINYAEDLGIEVDNQIVFNSEAQVLLERKIELINMQQKFVASAIEKKNTIIEAILAQLFGAAFEKNSLLQTVVANQYQINQQIMGAAMASARDWIIRENAIRNMEADAAAALTSFALTTVIGGFAGRRAGKAKSRTKAMYTGLAQLTNSSLANENFQKTLWRRGDKAFTENIPMFFGIDNFASVDTEFGDEGTVAKQTISDLGPGYEDVYENLIRNNILYSIDDNNARLAISEEELDHGLVFLTPAQKNNVLPILQQSHEGKFKRKTDEFAEKSGTEAMRDNEQARLDALKAKQQSGQTLSFFELYELTKLSNQNLKYDRAQQGMLRQRYDTIRDNSSGFSSVIKSTYGKEGIKGLRKAIRERAKEHRNKLEAQNRALFDEELLRLSYPGSELVIQDLKKKLSDKGLMDSANVIKVQRTDKGLGAIFGISNDLRQRKSVYMKSSPIAGQDTLRVYYTDGGETGILDLDSNQINMMNDLLASTRPNDYSFGSTGAGSIGRGLLSAALYYGSLGIIPSGLFETGYDEVQKWERTRDMLDYLETKDRPLNQLTIKELNELKSKAGIYWDEILTRMKDKGDVGASALWSKMNNAKKLPYSRGRLEQYLRGSIRDASGRKQVDYSKVTGTTTKFPFLEELTIEGTLSVEASSGEINACFDFFEESGIFDKDGVSQMPMLIDYSEQNIIDYLQKSGLQDQLTKAPMHYNLGSSSEVRAKSIVDMVATFLVSDVRECVVSSEQPGPPLPPPAEPLPPGPPAN